MDDGGLGFCLETCDFKGSPRQLDHCRNFEKLLWEWVETDLQEWRVNRKQRLWSRHTLKREVTLPTQGRTATECHWAHQSSRDREQACAVPLERLLFVHCTQLLNCHTAFHKCVRNCAPFKISCWPSRTAVTAQLVASLPCRQKLLQTSKMKYLTCRLC